MKNLDDDAVAWTFAMIVIALFVIAFLWAVTTPMINVVIDNTNERIADGAISGQTADAIQFNVTIYQYFPVFALGSMILLGIIVSLYQRKVDYT